MAENVKLPAGFVLDEDEAQVGLPEGFVVDQPATMPVQDFSKLYEGGVVPTPDMLQGAGDVALGLGSKLLQGATMGFSDELYGALLGEEAARLERERLKQMGEQYPAAGTTAEIAGALLGGGGVSGLAPGATRAITKYASRGLPQALGTGAATGAVSGGLYGAGTSEDRVKGAEEGFMLGGILGPAGVGVGAALPSVARGLGGLKQRAQRLFRQPQTGVARTAQEFAEQAATLPPATARPEMRVTAKIEQAIKQDFPDDYEQVLDVWRKGDVSLAELYGAKTRQLAKGAAQYPTGQQAAERFFEDKVAQAPEKIMKSISENINATEAFYATADDLVEAGRAKARPLYEKAYRQSIGKGKDILKTPEVNEALKRAKKQFPSELKGVKDDSIQALDYAKKILDDDIGKAQRAGEGNLARSRTMIKNELLKVMDEASPDYAQARKASGDYLSINKAMEDGKAFMKKDPEILAKQFKALSKSEKEAFKVGVAKQMRDLTEKTDGNTYNRMFGSPEKRKRLESVLSPVQFKNLASDLKSQDRLFRLRNEVIGGSPTTSKAIAAGEIAGLAGDIATTVKTGGSVPGIMSVGLRKLFDGLNDRTAKQVADIVYETRPEMKLKMYNAMVGQKGLNRAEREALKRTYFEIDDLFTNTELKGALAAGVIAGKGEQE